MKLKEILRHYLLPSAWVTIKENSANKTIFLSFDDGPNPDVTPLLLDLLDKHNAKVTFFCIGKKMLAYPELAKEIVARGHLVSNHSFTHDDYYLLPLTVQLREIVETDNTIADICGYRGKLFRPPKGRLSWKLLFNLIRMKKTAAMWSLDSMDYFYKSADDIIKRLKNYPISHGEIILLHDDSSLCIDALKELLPYWRQKGFEFQLMTDNALS